jgi:hypothetical protein
MEASNLRDRSNRKLPAGTITLAKHDKTPTPQARGKAVRKTTRKRGNPVRSKRNAIKGSGKSEKLVCRYCGSDDLSPSFIKRRDRRCRRCFSKRYGSTARAKELKA